MKLDYTTIQPIDGQINKKIAIIYIHGWKGNKNSFISIAKNMHIKSATWFFPEGPYTVDNNKDNKSWTYQKEDGSWELKKSKELLNDFMEKEVLKKFQSNNIFFIGFSQGAAVCYEYIISMNYSFGGVFAYAGFSRKNKKNHIINTKQLKTKIIIGHGKNDSIIHHEESVYIYKLLKKQKANVELLLYPGNHKIPISYLNLLKDYINEKI